MHELELLREIGSPTPNLPLQHAARTGDHGLHCREGSGLPQELGKIAGLYRHRVRLGMRLQADPTIIYGLGQIMMAIFTRWICAPTDPTNTYTRAGHAADSPSPCPAQRCFARQPVPRKTDAIYFVASTKGDGSHVFSGTLEQHNVGRVYAYVAHQRKSRAGIGAMNAAARFVTLEGIEGVAEHAGAAPVRGIENARHRACGDARPGRHASRREHAAKWC